MIVNWNERYANEGFAYGKKPNAFFKDWIQTITPGSILMPADGEGRNGVYAATLGWEVTSSDLSESGKVKAENLAAEHQVSIRYEIGDLQHQSFREASFDAIGLIYAHFPASVKSDLHKKLNAYLKPGGVVIFEAFSKNHLPYRKANPEVGGPIDIHMLFSEEEVQADFKSYEVLKLAEEEISLNEGTYHNGKGSVIRFVGRKLS